MDKLSIVLWRWIYTVALRVALPGFLLRLWWKGFQNPGYRYRWKDRLGIFLAPLRKGGLWIHAVSVGESMAAVPLIRELQKRFPNMPITVTSTTPTGYMRIENIFKDKSKLFHIYFPYDLPGCLTRFLDRVQPDLLILMETELWPNCLWICKKRNIPVMIVNGRLSPRSMQGLQRIKRLTKQMMDCLTQVVAQSEEDGARFIELGLPSKRLMVTGNIKFDMVSRENVAIEAIKLRVSFGSMRPVWIAASTHAGEEEKILLAFREIQKRFKDILLILVPRNPERFRAVIDLVESKGYSVVLRSSKLSVNSKTQILIGDTMGELDLLYAASDVAFVGGSLVPIGGHNTLEPAAVGIPVVVGPFVHNFSEITQLLQRAGALIQIKEVEELTEVVLRWLNKTEERQFAGEQGKKVIERNRGVVTTLADLIQKQIKSDAQARAVKFKKSETTALS